MITVPESMVNASIPMEAITANVKQVSNYMNHGIDRMTGSGADGTTSKLAGVS